ncbi:uncharacterized protein LOC110095700 [Dendrobium catenatum]|uniref:CUE domain-containing protein n=1 Tax=Dendrobium catenatum TaxID=906689 RepID=A0A2I0X6W1_9ASPA|nr:uncharacterized protein LOC110095700 [Dendrobium catenatum]XP_020677101.1 uncharacterized protein LOC110095700 [Dendrobium catenatum]PKU83653.1 hypothetical protein MA16_Dca020870 [Dendrobium catenatum]
MSSSSIFKSLRELFPQVDLRILRAISIEHEEDINEAIEFILSEVLPAANTKPDFPCILHDNGIPEQELRERDNGPEHINIPDDKTVSPFGMPDFIVGAENRGMDSLVADGTKGCVLWQPHLMFLAADSKPSTEQEESSYNNGLSLNLNHLSEKEDENFFYKPPNQNNHFESLSDGGPENIILTKQLTKYSEELETKDVFQLRDGENITVQLDEQTISSAVFDNNCESPVEYGSEKQNDINIELNVCDNLSGCSSDGYRPFNLHDLETVVYPSPVLTCALSLSGVSEKDQIYQDSINETYKDAIDYENHSAHDLDVNYLDISSEEYVLPIDLATQSGHAVSTDVVEESIEDAKISKKYLVCSLESMVSMMREVELLEGKAKQAQEEASVAGHHILSKVEELQQIVKQSKDENDMQSGQVYGERSILATEARELQSRLLRMSEERCKYLSVIEEIFGALEVRQSAAKDVIAAADLEKQEKEEVALKALKEQELLMDAVLAESQNLKQEEEENSKLREFLMDRGHVVDSLQGEIAIICEDILSLKQRVDGRIPFTRSLISSSFTKSLMSSFSSSCGSSVNSSEHNGGSPSSTNRLINTETHEKHQEVENTSLNSLDSRSNPLDDWELCEK